MCIWLPNKHSQREYAQTFRFVVYSAASFLSLFHRRSEVLYHSESPSVPWRFKLRVHMAGNIAESCENYTGSKKFHIITEPEFCSVQKNEWRASWMCLHPDGPNKPKHKTVLKNINDHVGANMYVCVFHNSSLTGWETHTQERKCGGYGYGIWLCPLYLYDGWTTNWVVVLINKGQIKMNVTHPIQKDIRAAWILLNPRRRTKTSLEGLIQM